VVDIAEHAKDVRRAVAEFMRNGEIIERKTVEEVRKQFCVTIHREGVCPHRGDCPFRKAKP